jgi:hypothetical protein
MERQQFIKQLSLLRPSSTFLTLHQYCNEYDEVSDYNIVFHISYHNALKKSLSILDQFIPSTPLEIVAKEELMDGYQKSLTKTQTIPIEEIDDAYDRFFDADGSYIKGVKLHRSTNTLHLYGLVNSKRVIAKGNYPVKADTRRSLTKTKDQLRKLCPVNNFRQFKITPQQVDHISVEHLSLLPPNV